MQDLVDTNDQDWDRIEYTLKIARQVFENTLFKLHFKRRAAFSATQKNTILRFLSMGYLTTNDLRYYNEFLWFCGDDEGAKELRERCGSHFKKNLDAKGRHSFPLCTVEEARLFVEKHRSGDAKSINTRLRIGLIGFPPFFAQIIKELKKTGFEIQQIFIPFHSNKYLKKALSVRVLVKVASLLRGNRLSYDTLNYHYKDPALGVELEKRNFDVGFHKLNFIINENVFSKFKRGLINDHWAVLPFIRGKSTIAYSVLLGFPLMPTLHKVVKGIDMGEIIGFYECDCSGITTLSGIREKFKATLPDRAVDAIKRLSSEEFSAIKNEPAGGLTYYEIHPELYKYAESLLPLDTV